MGDLSLVDGIVPLFFFVVCPVALILAFGWRSGAWKRQLLVGVGVAAVVTLVLFGINSLFHVIPYAFPFFFYVLGGLVALSIVVAIVGWRRDRNWQRIIS